MSVLIEGLVTPISRVFLGFYSSVYDDLAKIIPPELLPSPDATVSVLGFSVPAFLLYLWIADD